MKPINNKKQKDQIYANKKSSIGIFEFDEKVAAVFPDMIKRSIPGYSEMIALTGIIANQFATDNSRIYDLGCSLGASSLSLLQHVQAKTNLIAIDKAISMVEHCKVALSDAIRNHPNTSVDIRHQSIQDTKIDNASVIVLNFVLQFIKPDLRDTILAQIYTGLCSNGALLIAEKIEFENIKRQNQLAAWYHDYKKSNGYSELEITQKRTALEQIMICDTKKRLIERLKYTGFSEVNQWFQGLNFIALVATKR